MLIEMGSFPSLCCFDQPVLKPNAPEPLSATDLPSTLTSPLSTLEKRILEHSPLSIIFEERESSFAPSEKPQLRYRRLTSIAIIVSKRLRAGTRRRFSH